VETVEHLLERKTSTIKMEVHIARTAIRISIVLNALTAISQSWIDASLHLERNGTSITLSARNVLSDSKVETSMNAMENLSANSISILLSHPSVWDATNQFEVIASTHWDLSGIQSTFLVHIAKSRSLVEASSSLEESLIARLITINKQDHSALVAESRSLDGASMHLRRNGIQNISFVRSV